MAQQKWIRPGTMRMWVRVLASLSGLRIQCRHELWCRLQTWLGSGMLLWLWCRLAAAALIGPLAGESPYTAAVALKRQKEKKKKSESFPEGKIHYREDVAPAPKSICKLSAILLKTLTEFSRNSTNWNQHATHRGEDSPVRCQSIWWSHKTSLPPQNIRSVGQNRKFRSRVIRVRN